VTVCFIYFASLPIYQVIPRKLQLKQGIYAIESGSVIRRSSGHGRQFYGKRDFAVLHMYLPADTPYPAGVLYRGAFLASFWSTAAVAANGFSPVSAGMAVERVVFMGTRYVILP
jgi:hypothetical protein